MREARRTAWTAGALVAAGLFYYITFVQFGLLELVHRRLGLRAEQLPAAMALLTVAGLASAVAAGRWLERGGRTRAARYAGIAACCGVQAVLAVAALGVARGAHVAVLCAGLGLTLGWNSCLSLALLFTEFTPERRWLAAGGVIAAVYAAANVPPLVFGRPEVLVAANALLMAGAAPVAWFARRRPAPVAAAAAPPAPREPLAQWLPVLLALVFIDSYTFQRVVATPVLRALTWGGPAHIWINGLVHGAGALGAGWLAQRHGPRGLALAAAAALLGAETLLGAGAAGLGGGYVLTALYNTSVSAYFVILLGLWPACLGAVPDRRLGLAVAATCWLGAPAGVGAGLRFLAVGNAAGFGVPAAALAVLAVWLMPFTFGPGRPRVAWAKE